MERRNNQRLIIPQGRPLWNELRNNNKNETRSSGVKCGTSLALTNSRNSTPFSLHSPFSATPTPPDIGNFFLKRKLHHVSGREGGGMVVGRFQLLTKQRFPEIIKVLRLSETGEMHFLETVNLTQDLSTAQYLV